MLLCTRYGTIHEVNIGPLLTVYSYDEYFQAKDINSLKQIIENFEEKISRY